MENAFKMEFFNSAKFFNNAKNQLEFTKETRFARYQSKFSLIFGIKKKFCFVEKIFHFLSVVHTTNTQRSFDLCTLFRLRNCVILILNFDPQFQKLHQFGTAEV